MKCLTLTQLAHRYGITWLMCHIYLPPHMAAFGTYMCIYGCLCMCLCIYGCVFVFVCVCVRERESLAFSRFAVRLRYLSFFIFYFNATCTQVRSKRPCALSLGSAPGIYACVCTQPSTALVLCCIRPPAP